MSPQSTSNAADTRLKKDLLFFFQNRHPYTKCSAGVISCAVSRVKRGELEQALECLVTDEFIEKHTNQQGQLYYCLATNPRSKNRFSDYQHTMATAMKDATGYQLLAAVKRSGKSGLKKLSQYNTIKQKGGLER